MTTKIYINTSPAYAYPSTKEAFPSVSLAKKKATELRRRGLSTKIEEITLKKLPKKELLCALFNHQFEALTEASKVVKVLEGLKRVKVVKVEPESDGA
jgi:hypothetical protein